METSVIKPLRDFIHQLSLRFGCREEKLMIALSPKLYDHAWRELVDGYKRHVSVPSHDIPPKQISFFTLGFEIVLMPVKESDND